MSPERQLAELLAAYQRKLDTNQLARYEPYPYQIKFHHADGYLTPGKLAFLRAIIAANKIGKTWGACFEGAMHLTGRYPEWWRGHGLNFAPEMMCASVTNDLTRDHLQRLYLGDPEDDKALGTGTIPRECIGRITRKAGVPNAIDTVLIKHKSGKWAKLKFLAYEMGFKKFMARGTDVSHLDEEPPQDILSQVIRATFAKRHAFIMATFTPEEGMTQVVSQLLNDIQRGQAVITATWDDAPHMTPEVRAEKLSNIPEHEREMRAKGTPLAGAGLIFSIPDEKIIVQPFEIPKHWRQITGIDFGWDHPFGAAKLAWDLDSDCIYVTADYRESKAIPAVHAATVNAWGAWVPVAWPHDGLNAEKGTGESLIQKYRDAHVNTLEKMATNPPAPGDDEGEGGNSVETPIMEILERMHTNRWKVFSTCRQWLEEKRMYHRDLNLKIVKYADDCISASRYAYMMRRHATTEIVRIRKQVAPIGASNWR